MSPIFVTDHLPLAMYLNMELPASSSGRPSPSMSKADMPSGYGPDFSVAPENTVSAGHSSTCRGLAGISATNSVLAFWFQ